MFFSRVHKLRCSGYDEQRAASQKIENNLSVSVSDEICPESVCLLSVVAFFITATPAIQRSIFT